MQLLLFFRAIYIIDFSISKYETIDGLNTLAHINLIENQALINGSQQNQKVN